MGTPQSLQVVLEKFFKQSFAHQELIVHTIGNLQNRIKVLEEKNELQKREIADLKQKILTLKESTREEAKDERIKTLKVLISLLDSIETQRLDIEENQREEKLPRDTEKWDLNLLGNG